MDAYGGVKKAENGTSNSGTNVIIKKEETNAIKKKVYLTAAFAACACFIYLMNLLLLRSFCDYDGSKELYIIPYTSSETIIDIVTVTATTADSPSRGSIPLNSNRHSSDEQDTSNHASSPSKPSSSFAPSLSAVDVYHKKSSFNNISKNICYSSHYVLDFMGMILHPYIDYNTILPKTIQKSPTIPALEENPVSDPNNLSKTAQDGLITSGDAQNKNFSRYGRRLLRNPIQMLVQFCNSIFKKLTHFFRIKRKDSETQKAENEASGDEIQSQSQGEETQSSKRTDSSDDDWTFYVSVPPKLNLSSQQKDILQKTGDNLLERLKKQLEEGEYNQKLEDMYWGGKGTEGRFASFPWWFPTEGKMGTSKDGESSGERLLAAYLKIMKWPNNLITKFPLSPCIDGCPTDFALAHTLEYREKYKPWAITPGAFADNEKGWIYVRGYSPTRYHTSNEKGGSSVIWYRPGIQKIPNGRYEEYFRTLIHAIDTCVADSLQRSNGQIGKCNVVLDAKGFGLSYIPPISATKKLMLMMQDHFPDRLGVLVIANMARAAQIFFKMVMPFLPIEVRRKIHLLPSEGEDRMDMLGALVVEEFIPIWLGGKDAFIFDSTEYYKSGKYKSDFISDEEGLEYIETMPYHA